MNVMEWYGRKRTDLLKDLSQCQFCPSKVSRRLDRDWTLVYAVRSGLLIAWTMLPDIRKRISLLEGYQVSSFVLLIRVLLTWKMVGYYRHTKAEMLGRKTLPVPLCPCQTPSGLALERTWACVMRDIRLTTWSMSRPFKLGIHQNSI